jgi:hypothetical protein
MACLASNGIRPRGIGLLILVALLLILHSGTKAQPAQGRGASGRVGPDRPVVASPGVPPDRRITFRLYAPGARQVRAVFEGAERTSGVPFGGVSLVKAPTAYGRRPSTLWMRRLPIQLHGGLRDCRTGTSIRHRRVLAEEPLREVRRPYGAKEHLLFWTIRS